MKQNEITHPNGNKKTFPNLFLLGGSKCASSTLSGWLGQHPEILLATPKEPNFFHTDEYQEGMEYYSKKFFRGFNQEKYRLDASPINLVIKYVVQRIAASCPNENKFLLIVREPMERAYSEYRMYSGWRPGRCMETFEKEMIHNLKYFSHERYSYEYEVMSNRESKGGLYFHGFIESSLYFNNISGYIKEFGRENIFIETLEKLCENPHGLYSEIIKFLKIKEYAPVLSTRNVSGEETTRLPELIEGSDTLNKIAKEIFLPDIEKLSRLINEDLISKWGYNKL